MTFCRCVYREGPKKSFRNVAEFGKVLSVLLLPCKIVLKLDNHHLETLGQLVFEISDETGILSQNIFNSCYSPSAVMCKYTQVRKCFGKLSFLGKFSFACECAPNSQNFYWKPGTRIKCAKNF